MKDKIQKDLIESMKSGSKNDVEILRFVISLIKKEEKDKNKDFSDSEVIQVLKKAIKRNQDAFEQFSKAGRDDLAEKEQTEIKIISRYLPDELSSSEIEKLISKIVKPFFSLFSTNCINSLFVFAFGNGKISSFSSFSKKTLL